MMFELEKAADVDARRRRGLALSAALHCMLLVFLLVNPDFLSTTPRRVVRVQGEDFDRDRFEIVELELPPDLVTPPEVAEVPPPVVEVPAPEVEATPPPPPPPPPEPLDEPELPPIPPPPVIGPDDVVADGARPDAPETSPEEPEETVRPEPPTGEPEPAGNGEDGGAGTPVEAGNEPQPVPATEEEPLQVAENTNPNALVLPNLRRQASSLIDETLAERPLAGGNGDSSNVLPNLTTDRPEILSDTRGYDFGPYMNQVINRVRTNWYALIPEAARIGTLRGRVIIVFTITSNGRIENLRAAAVSGAAPLDRAAAAAIQASNPFPRLPADFGGENLVLQFTFLYNMPESR